MKTGALAESEAEGTKTLDEAERSDGVNTSVDSKIGDVISIFDSAAVLGVKEKSLMIAETLLYWNKPNKRN